MSRQQFERFVPTVAIKVRSVRCNSALHSVNEDREHLIVETKTPRNADMLLHLLEPRDRER